jgi:hypothetical protein
LFPSICERKYALNGRQNLLASLWGQIVGVDAIMQQATGNDPGVFFAHRQPSSLLPNQTRAMMAPSMIDPAIMMAVIGWFLAGYNQ